MLQVLVSIVVIFGQVLATVDQVFIENELVPDVIDKPPTQLIEITYPSVMVNLGNYLTPTQVLKPPQVKFNGDPNKYHLLVMIDPDALSRVKPTMREFALWLVGNIPGDNVCDGETIFAYVPTGPPKTSGVHRYTFLVYEQQGHVNFDETRISNMSVVGRPKFSISNFVNKYSFGEPIFGNFFHSQYDDSVPMIHSMLGIELE